MKLILTEDDGTVLDSTELTRPELDAAQRRQPWRAQEILGHLQAGEQQ